MKSLIIGAAGFVGYYLIQELYDSGDEVYATKLNNETIDAEKMCNIFDLDIVDLDSVKSLLDKIKPDVIYHLAAQSSVSLSWKKPQLTANINIIGTINILEAVREICPNCKILLVGSSEEYGPINTNSKINESFNTNPQNLYALTKTTCEQLGKIYVKAYDMDILMTRSFNHIGPRQTPVFVVPDFCSQVAKIEKGLQNPVIKVGNLSASRDFTDVRDIVSAYRIIVSKGCSGEVYNVGTGKAIMIREVLDLILKNSVMSIDVEIDKAKFRPIDIPKIEPDVSKLLDLGWKPKFDVNDSIISILDFFRKLY